MKKLFITLLASSILSTACAMVKQPEFQDAEVLSRVDSIITTEVKKRMNYFPRDSSEKLTKAFNCKEGKRLLWRVRGYGSPQGFLLPEGEGAIKEIVRQNDKIALLGEPIDHARILIPSAKNELLLPLLSNGRRVTDSGEVQVTYGCEYNMLSSLILWTQIKNALERKKQSYMVELPDDMRAWNHSKVLHPTLKQLHFSDLDFLITHKPLSPNAAPTKTDLKEHLTPYCKDEGNREILMTLARAGVWSYGMLGFAEDGQLQVRKFQQPDNTTPENSMTPEKLAWNRHAFLTGLVGLLNNPEDTEAQSFFKDEDNKALAEHRSYQ